jgi:hypothetical protein
MWDDHLRRFSPGRDWPKDIELTFSGYSIGRWIDEDSESRNDALEVETRGFKGPRRRRSNGPPCAVDPAAPGRRK